MGLFSSIGGALFGDPSGDIKRAAGIQQAGFQRGEDYLTGIDELPLELRNQALQQLQGFYMGDPESQSRMIESIEGSPFYDFSMRQGQEGVLGEAGRFGLSRSGNTTSDLFNERQRVLQGHLSQRLGGLQGFANPNLNTSNIVNMMTGGAGAEAGGITAAAQAQQDLAGQAIGTIMSGIGMAGNFGGGSPNVMPGPPGSNISDYTGSAYSNWLAQGGG